MFLAGSTTTHLEQNGFALHRSNWNFLVARIQCCSQDIRGVKQIMRSFPSTLQCFCTDAYSMTDEAITVIIPMDESRG